MKTNHNDSWMIQGLKGASRGFFALALAVTASSAIAAANVTYAVSDLPDVVQGEDLWSYTYAISGPLAAFETINVFFAPANYGANIEVLTSDATFSPLLTPSTLDPETSGILSLTAVDPLLAGTTAQVGVQFVWLQPGTPGPQNFQLLDDQFNEMSTGMTSAVPEANPASLLLVGMLAMAPMLRRRRAG